ncbi:hypothetical protein NO2_1568, partial [Candidatus Termititenax persephonae]
FLDRLLIILEIKHCLIIVYNLVDFIQYRC